MKFLSAVVVVLAAQAALAYGPWLEKPPIGGVELSDGWSREQLERRLDEIAAANTNKPFIVTRTQWLTTVFDHVRLAVSTNDCFVHWHADCAILPLRFLGKMQELSRVVSRENGLACGGGVYFREGSHQGIGGIRWRRSFPMSRHSMTAWRS